MSIQVPPDGQTTRTVLLGPGEGARLEMGQTADHMIVKADGTASAGHLTLVEYHARPGSAGVPLHMHDGHEEGFYVLSGELEMQLDDRVGTFGPGSFAFVPRGVAHRFANPGPKPCVFLATFSPAGFERLFSERAALVAERGEDADALLSLARAHGVTYLDSPEQAAPRP